MTSLLASRRRAEEFARLVDGTGRSADPTLRDLHSVAMRLRPSAVEPSEQFRTALRERLVVAAARASIEGSGGAAAGRSGGAGSRGDRSARPVAATPRRSRIVAVAAAVVLAGGVAGTAVAARDAQPGGMFYPIKIGLERTQVAVASSQESRGREYLTHASTRLTEVSRMAGDAPLRDADTERVDLARTTLDQVSADTRRGADLLLRAHQADRNTAPVVAIRDFTADARPRLRELRPLLPRGLSGAYARAAATIADADRRARAACPTCGTTTADPDSPERATSPRPTPTSGPTTGPTSGPVPPTPGPARPPRGPGPVPTNPGPGGPLPSRTADPLPLPLPTLTVPLPGPNGPGTPNPKPTTPGPTGTPTTPPPGLPLPLPLPTLPLPLPLPLPN
ncbi:hypothetical protein SAMN05421678_103373 [Actinopolymorpha cephalotaxi]|uniref:DUF5667 domain-containing protein n=1 Tax=Actinopolymorpha cephalotaxi TaxID=504797 RepID=A0A1I2NP15_9ACTN|nr:DUF5667 domain-containing protein [Actinopolymorpha cephalotaxi]NYH85519.1 hypothetical protein [Actinopolymorpha cephalotaxi]SFG03031.1 hypothetical protein SAMN05421678_103373 [Actinopolymorpha cephalotaxi]